MFRALLLKEWKQLRALRWVGLGLGLVVLLVALAAPAAARQGWLPFAEITRSYSAREVLLDALPAALAIGLWPLIALLVVVQSFAGDRNTGTESFLLERPVPRARIWSARLLASAGTVVVATVGHLALWWAVTKLSVDPASQDLSRAIFMLGAVGPAAAFCCLVAGMLAASLLSSPMAALLLGIVPLAIPLQLAGTLVGAFPLAAYRGIPVGPIAPILLLLAYPLASFLALCRGEPAGRGRIKRGVVTVAVVLVAACGLFVVTATAAIRLSARALPNGAQILPAKGSAYASGDSGGWIVDPDTADAHRFVAGPIWRAAWNDEGSRLAVIAISGPLGSQSATEHLKLYDEDGRMTTSDLHFGEGEYVNHILWAGDRLLLAMMTTTGLSRIVIYSPETGEKSTVPVKLESWSWSLVGPTEDGRVFLAYDDGGGEDQAGQDAEETGKPRRGTPYALYEIDVKRGELSDEPLLRDFGVIWYLQFSRLSPSGRFWLVDDGRADEPGIPVLDLETGARVVVDADPRSTRWLAGDRLAWTKTAEERIRLMLGVPGEELRVLREWTGLRVELEVPPGGKSLLVMAVEALEEQKAAAFPGTSFAIRRRVDGTAVFDLETGRWIDLEPWPREAFEGWTYRTVWADSRSLARTGPGVLAFESIDAPGELHPFLGTP